MGPEQPDTLHVVEHPPEAPEGGGHRRYRLSEMRLTLVPGQRDEAHPIAEWISRSFRRGIEASGDYESINRVRDPRQEQREGAVGIGSPTYRVVGVVRVDRQSQGCGVLPVAGTYSLRARP